MRNIPEALECALAIPLLGAVLNANNVRLEASALGYIRAAGVGAAGGHQVLGPGREAVRLSCGSAGDRH